VLSRRKKVARLFRKIVLGRLAGSGPFFLSHLVTARCNCRCPGCLWRDNNSAEMGTQEVEDLYRAAAKRGFVANVLWGGEPLLRKDLPRLCSTSQLERMLTVVITNGYYLAERCEELVPHVDGLIISLDYARPENHDAYRRCPGLFARAVEGIRRVRSRYPKVRVFLNCLLHRGNEEEVEEVACLGRELGVSVFFSPAMEGLSLENGFHNKEALPVPESLRKAAARLLELKKSGLPVNNSRRYLQEYLLEGQGFSCRVPLVFMTVMADGTALNCFTPERPLGNIREEGFEGILDKQSRKKLLHLGQRCQKCIVPDVVDTSFIWQLSPEPLYNTLRVFLKGEEMKGKGKLLFNTWDFDKNIKK